MVIVSYDISNDKLRTSFAKYLSRFGHRIQYSVFEIDNSKRIVDKMDRISTTVEIILYYLTTTETDGTQQSTTVEIILYYLTYFQHSLPIHIYNSRNYSILLNYPLLGLYTHHLQQ